MTPALPRIWIITDPRHPKGPVAPLRRALVECPPGRVGVQLRAKSVSDRRILEWGRELRELTEAHGCVLTVNRRPDLALILGAAGVHLPERGLPPLEVREGFSSLSMIGVSAHDRSSLQAAQRNHASYAYLSPIFEVPGKATPMGIHGFRAAIADVGIPTYALGGIQAEDLKPLWTAGAFGVAIRRAIYDAAEPERALQGFLSALDKMPASGE